MPNDEKKDQEADRFKPKQSIPDFGSSYEKARRAYSLASAVLLGWELIGVELDRFFEGYHVVLKSPQAVPFVLLALVLYFMMRFTIEWYQAAEERRLRLVSRLDFSLAHALAATAIGVYAVQAILSIQLADYVRGGAILGLGVGVFMRLLILEQTLHPQPRARRWPSVFRAFVGLQIIGVLVAAAVLLDALGGSYLLATSAMVAGLVAMHLLILLARGEFGLMQGEPRPFFEWSWVYGWRYRPPKVR